MPPKVLPEPDSPIKLSNSSSVILNVPGNNPSIIEIVLVIFAEASVVPGMAPAENALSIVAANCS